jgi:SAM-dependent methyltransferase
MNDQPIALEAYEELAEAFAERVETKPHNAYYERPAMLALLPEVRGKRVLDAGCGPGAYTARLIDMGAGVVAVDVSPKMVQLAKARVGDRADIRLADIGRPMPFFQDKSFDIILCPLVLDYIRDYRPVFREFFRILKNPATLLFSVGHPFSDYAFFKSQDYFATERVGCEWQGFGKPVYVPSYRRPLGEILNPLMEVGFVPDRIEEPLPTLEFQAADPRDFERLMKFPAFLCVRAGKR